MDHRMLAAAAALALAAGLAGCDDDDATTTDTTAATDTSTATGGSEPDAEAIEVTAVDYAFEGVPDEVRAGTTLGLHNDSTLELHELVAMRIPDEEARPVEELLALPEEELGAVFAAPPALVLVAPPGEDGFVALGDGALVEPGRYAVVCFIPTGADPQAYLDALEANPGQPPSVDGGPPHLTQGMARELTVS